MTPSEPSFTASLGRLGRLTRKEMSESLRDRRTILTLVLMPVLLYPLLTIAFQQMLLSRRVEDLKPVYRIGFVSKAELDALRLYWKFGEEHFVRRHSPPVAKGEEPSLAAYLDPLPELKSYLPTDLEEEISAGNLDVGVRLRPLGGFQVDLRRPLHIECDLIYREGSTKGREAVQYLELLTADANDELLVGQMLHARKIPQRGDPIRVRAAIAPDATPKKSFFPVLVPLILILMTMTGAVYPAIDLTAGERERGTLEILVAAPIPRLWILLAKYVAVFTVAMLTAIVNIGSMAVTLRVTGIGAALFGPSFTLGALMQVLALLLLFAAFFSAVLLTLTSFARSFKEAQAYIIPLMLLCLTPGMMALMPGLSLNGPLAVVPLINIVLLARDVFEGGASPSAAVVVVMATLLYAVAAIAVAARIFGAEAVLTSEVGGWGDVFRRPVRPRPTAEPSGALLCLALMFPAYFLLTNGLAIEGLNAAERLGLTALANLAMFGGFPLIAAWRGRVRLQSCLRLYAPSWQACAAALLLGACLWPFAHEVSLFLRDRGIATFQGEHVEKVRKFLEECRAYSPVLIVTVLALIPAVVEELFFRGFLFTALLGKGDHPGRAVLASAALFAAFHLLVMDGLAVERLLPSLLMGMVLAWMCYKSGSVVPGVLLHALHNGLLVLMAYYEPRLKEMGWTPSAEDHLPAWLLGSAAVGAVLGLVGMWRLRPERRTEQASE